MLGILHINKNDIPYSTDIRVAGETFIFTFNYNAEGDFFTVDLTKNGEVLALGEKIVYGRALFISYADERFPKAAIVPIDLALNRDWVGWAELENDVFLYVVEGDPNENE